MSGPQSNPGNDTRELREHTGHDRSCMPDVWTVSGDGDTRPADTRPPNHVGSLKFVNLLLGPKPPAQAFLANDYDDAGVPLDLVEWGGKCVIFLGCLQDRGGPDA